MENMLEHFYILCEGYYLYAIVLNNLYYEARRQCGQTATITVEFLDLKARLGGLWQYDACELMDIFIALEEGMDILTYKADKEHTLIHKSTGTKCPGRIFCTIDPKLIETRIQRCQEEAEKVKRHNKRALELGLPATLTIEGWIGILNHYQWGCAYCFDRRFYGDSGNYDVLEHIIPLTFPDSGTTHLNCVPSCYKCNSLKGAYHPDRMPKGIERKIGAAIKYVREQQAHYHGDSQEE